MVILVYFSRFGMLYQEKSGNPAEETRDLLVSVYFQYRYVPTAEPQRIPLPGELNYTIKLQYLKS
jgi:hypothetical protein